ncbi:TPR repeat-containing protein YrrB [Maioricimonas rarisocia]|uniref:TPR repeat-containing protein YrrB n=1 Tax=Maioricimonas rarisocia TaxID=2528026 RepID=A0A517Z2W3_9PLAN|nr:tetratricopeptide repeat protein [Maioricimonas rarisocia]QDU36819.1 TPR repeat-containing protein YrrB [Maioricimonas rarisocia]
MNDAAPTPAKPKKSWRRRAGTVLLWTVALTPGIAHWIWTATRPVEIPSVSESEVTTPVQEAIEAAREAVGRAPQSDEAWGQLGMTFLAHGLRDEAEVCLLKAAEIDPSDPRWPYLLIPEKGSIDPALAEKRLREVIALDARPPVPRLRLAELLWKQERLEEAEEIFREVAEQYPDIGRARLGLGRIAFARGELEASRRHLEQAVALAPAAIPAHQLLAQVYQRLGDTKAAREQLAHLESLPPKWSWPDPWWAEVASRSASAQNVVTHAGRLRDAGRFEEALDVLEAAAREHPDSPELTVALGMVLIDLKDGARAEDVFARGIELAPEMVVPYLGMGHALALQDRLEAAIEQYRRALEMDPRFAEAHLAMGQCFVRSGQLNEAADALSKAVRHDPNLIDGQILLGATLMDLDRLDEAGKALEAAALVKPNHEVVARLRDELASRRENAASSVADE